MIQKCHDKFIELKRYSSRREDVTFAATRANNEIFICQENTSFQKSTLKDKHMKRSQTFHGVAQQNRMIRHLADIINTLGWK